MTIPKPSSALQTFDGLLAEWRENVGCDEYSWMWRDRIEQAQPIRDRLQAVVEEMPHDTVGWPTTYSPPAHIPENCKRCQLQAILGRAEGT